MAKQIKKHGKITLVLGLILVLSVLYGFIPLVKAGTVTSRSDTISDSRPSTASNHTIQFTVASAVDEGDTITVTFDSAFNTATIVEDDVDITDDTVDLTTAVDCTGAEQASAVMAADVLTITICAGDGGAIAAASVVAIQVGTNATASGTGVNQITNPALLGCTGASSVCDIDVAGTFGDTGKMKVAIISGVTVSATVSESLSFAIAAVTNANCDTSFAAYAGPDSTATTVPFGTLAAVDTFNHACQDLTLSTNADGGYAVTLQELTNLRDSVISQNIADSTGDNNTMDESTSDTWATAAGNDGFGYSCANNAGGGTDCAFTFTNYRQIACTGSNANCDPGVGGETQQTVMSNANPVSGSSSRIEYKLTVSGTQAAGTYSNTVMYIATPTY